MNYKKKRIKSGLGIYTIAKELGVDEEKYRLVEQGKLNLEKDLLDRFLDIIKRSKEIKFNREARLVEINEWIKSGQAEKDIERMGYDKYLVAEKLGHDKTYVHNMLKSSDSEYYDGKEKLYDFIKNPLNKNVDNKKTEKTKNFSVIVKEEDIDKEMLDKWIESGQAKKDVENSGYSQFDLSRKLFNKSVSYVNGLITTARKVEQYKAKQKLYDFLHNTEEPIEADTRIAPAEVEIYEASVIEEPIEVGVKMTKVEEPTTCEIPNCEEECPNCDATSYLLENMTSEFSKLKERYETLDVAYKLVTKENAELLKENQYLKESIRRMFRL